MVAFTATAAGGIGPYTYVWTFGDGASAAYGPSVNHTFLVVGTYRAVVNVTDSFGEPGNASVVITVAPPVLSVVLTATPSSLAAGAPTSLEANATGGTPPYAYEWTGMPAGCVGGNLASIRCVPSGPGGYTIRVNVTDTLGGSASSFVGLVVSGASGGGGAGANSLSTLQLAGIVSIVAAAGIAGGVGGSWLRRRWRRSR